MSAEIAVGIICDVQVMLRVTQCLNFSQYFERIKHIDEYVICIADCMATYKSRTLYFSFCHVIYIYGIIFHVCNPCEYLLSY